MNWKLKSFFDSERTFLAALLCLIGIVSYQLGQESVLQTGVDSNQPVSNDLPAGIIFTDVQPESELGEKVQVVASRSGTKYHKLECSGADSIKEENKIYFDSVELAKAAGYTPAANCDF